MTVNKNTRAANENACNADSLYLLSLSPDSGLPMTQPHTFF